MPISRARVRSWRELGGMRRVPRDDIAFMDLGGTVDVQSFLLSSEGSRKILRGIDGESAENIALYLSLMERVNR